MKTRHVNVRIAAIVMAVLMVALMVGYFNAQAAASIYVRPLGDDTLCNGTADVDYSVGVAPNCAVATIGQGVTLVDPYGTVHVGAGTYTLSALVDLNKPGITLDGDGQGVTIVQVSGTGERIKFSAAGVTLQDFEIVKTDKAGVQNIIYIGASDATIANNAIHGQFVIGDGDISRAMVVEANAFSGLNITGNTIYDLRQPAYISGTHTGTIQNNYVYNTKGWVIEGGNLTFTGNTWGINVYDIAILSAVPGAYYTDIVAMSNNNNGAVIEDQRVSPAVLSVAYVDASTAFATDLGGRYHPYSTITPAITRVVAGGTIKVAPGVYNEALLVTKPLTLSGAQAGVAVGGRTAGSAAESVINGSGNLFVVTVKASNVVVDGFDILGNAATNGGVYLYASTGSGNLSNIQVKNNFIHGMKLPNPSSTAYVTSYGVFSIGDAVGGVRRTYTGLVIQGNKIYDLGGAVVGADTSAGAGVWLYSLTGGGGGGGALVSGNTFQNIQNGLDGGVPEFGLGVAIVDDGDAVPDSGGLVQGNTYSGTFLGGVLFAGTTTFNEAAASFTGATMYALNVGNLATVNEATLSKYAKSNMPTGFASSTAYFAGVKHAVDYSDSGATIDVTAGTFVEGPQVTISKNITIDGAGRTNTFLVPSANTGNSGDSRGWFLVTSGNTFNLSDVTLDGTGKSVYQGIRSYGTGSILSCDIKNISAPGYNGLGVVLFGNMSVVDNAFSNIGRVGVIAFGTSSTTSVINNNTFTGKGIGDWLDYAVEIGGGAGATIGYNVIANNRGVASTDGSTSAGILVSTYYGAGTTATVFRNTITNSTTAIDVGYDGSDTSTVTAANNCMSGNDYGITTTASPVAGSLNFWGHPSGPYNAISNPTGLGDDVGNNVSFAPWRVSCPLGALTGNFQNVNTGEFFATLQDAENDADTLSGHTLKPVTSGPWSGTTTIDKPGLTINLNGATFKGSSSAFVISAPDTTITGPGLLDGWTGSANNASPAIEVLTGGDNLILDGVEIKRWDYGMIVQAPVESLKVVNNWIHTNTNIGLFVAAAPTGVVTIEGNLFKDNGGAGIGYGGAGTLKARYNSWGDDAGPTGTYGDGVTPGVDYTPWGFAEFYIDVDPTVPGDDTIRTVSEGTTFNVDLMGDAENLYGLSFKFTYDNTKLTLNGGSPTFAAPWTGTCVNPPPGAPSTGTVAFVCKLTSGPEWDGGVIANFNFTAAGIGLTGSGPWDAYFDISHLEANTSAGALGGVKVWMNNAGYNAPTTAARDITDADDGKITIDGLAAFTGFVDLEGRPNDSGALLKVFNDNLGTTLLAQATSASSGKYTTSPVLVTMTNYFLYVDRPLFLPTYAYWSKLLDTRPLTTLAQLLLLGGDATDDNLIDVGDATCIGGAYGVGPSLCGGVGSSSDVNGDGVINILDLTLMGGNYTKNVSPWTP